MSGMTWPESFFYSVCVIVGFLALVTWLRWMSKM